MTKKDLLKKLENVSDDTILCIGEPFNKGWSNIEEIREDETCIYLIPELYPLFSDN